MYRLTRSLSFLFGLFLTFHLLADPGPMSIWFSTQTVPGDANSWYQWSLPIGNGKLAAMVYGGINTEQIQFNADTIWGGQPHDYQNANATPAHLASLQNDCFNFVGDSTMWANEQSYLVGTPLYHAGYQTAGVIMLSGFPQNSSTSNYLRSLNLSNATVNVHYDYNGVTYNRDVFASAPSNRVIAVHFTASQPNSIGFTCSFSTLQTATYNTYASSTDLVMHASVTGWNDPNYGLANLVQYDARLRLITTNGTVTTTSSSISVANANDVVLLLSVASNYTNYNTLTTDYPTICSNNVAAAAALGFPALRQAQQADYTNLFNRVVLDLGTSSRVTNDLASRRLQASKVDGNDPQLVALDFQLGRYLMISGSRPGSQPLNLQGKWNDLINPNWRSEMTLNINEEMNYWGAEVCNLSECTGPLFDMMYDLTKTGAVIATNTYNSTGWVVHHNTDFWRAAAPCNNQAGIWPMGAAWLCQHVWWHYLYTGDTNWLATNGYPLMKGAAQFFQGYLVTNKYPNLPGYLVTCPSDSPEQALSNSITTVAGPTMDNELLRDLFSHVMTACQVLNTDADFSLGISNRMAQLPPDQVSPTASHYLQEWLQDSEQESRHCSHMVGFFPGDEISTFYTPVTAAAVRQSIYLRGDDGVPPWGTSWRINLRTRLMDGDGAWTNLMFEYTFNGKVSTNLVFGDTSNRQLDAAFGRLSGIATMFLQSPRGEIILLPALPTQLSTNGLVSGLCAEGGFEVDNMTWTNGRLTGATILSKCGNVCNLRSKWPIIVLQGSSVISAPMVLPGLYQFATAAGSNYTILPATIAEAENLFATTNGATQQTITNAAMSNWRAAQFNATAPGNSVTYLVTNVAAGAYHLYITANAATNCGQFQLACGTNGGAFTDVGSVQDTYSSSNMVYLLPIRINTPTNLVLLWTNMQREFDCGNWTATNAGNYNFRLTVTGKNIGSSSYVLMPDYIKLAPATAQAPANSAPTDMALSNTNVAENQPSGTAVGTFSSTDPDSGNTFTYSLVSGTGSTDNGSFTISGSTLQTAASFNFEVQNSYSVRVRTTDQGGLFFEKTFIINVTDVNEAPVDVTLSNSTVAENQPSGTAVGTFSSTDPDSGNTFTYSLVSGAGSTDNGAFTISGNTLQTAAVFNFEAQNSFSIRVRTTDQGGLFFEKVFTVLVTDVNEPPFTPTNLVPVDGAADQSPGLTLQASAFSDPDAGDTQQAAEWLVRRVADSVLIFDSGTDTSDKTSIAVPSGALEYVTSCNWQVRYEDSHGAWSSYSAPTTFTTTTPLLTATEQDGNLLLIWPTNATGFSLESSTDLSTSNWAPASPAPVVVGGNNVVTNPADGQGTFYRLNKP